MFNFKLPRHFISVSVILSLILILSEWIQAAVPYGSGFMIINVMMVTGRIVSDIGFFAGAIGLGIGRAILAYKFLHSPSRFKDSHLLIRYQKSGLWAVCAFFVYFTVQKFTNSLLDSSALGYYFMLWIGFQVSTYLLWAWIEKQTNQRKLNTSRSI